MKRLQPSGREKSIVSIWEWYEYHLRITLLSKVGIQNKIIRGNPDVDPVFLGMPPDEIDGFFRELDFLTMLDLMSATDATIRLEYWTRVDKRYKDPVSRALRKLYKRKGLNVRLEDLLNAWVAAKPSLSGPVGDFKGALHLRHWLAHGRYWHQIFARDYSPGDVFDICFALQEGIGE
jgi:hypothetical protein